MVALWAGWRRDVAHCELARRRRRRREAEAGRQNHHGLFHSVPSDSQEFDQAVINFAKGANTDTLHAMHTINAMQ